MEVDGFPDNDVGFPDRDAAPLDPERRTKAPNLFAGNLGHMFFMMEEVRGIVIVR